MPLNRSTLPSSLPAQLDHSVRYLFTDVDDTLTWEGKLPAATYNALEQLQKAGVQVIPVTGACAGWCDCIVRTWPVAAVIGENGAFWMQKDSNGHVQRRYMQSQEERAANKTRLLAVQKELLAELGFARMTVDQTYRETDIAFDVGQEQNLTSQQRYLLLDLLHQSGVQARLSSIHINAWLGDYDKASSAMAWLEQESVQQGRVIADQEVAFIGDSGNDVAMFEQFSNTVGVANIQPFLESLSHRPRYITAANGGFGFVELADRILAQTTLLESEVCGLGVA